MSDIYPASDLIYTNNSMGTWTGVRSYWIYAIIMMLKLMKLLAELDETRY